MKTPRWEFCHSVHKSADQTSSTEGIGSRGVRAQMGPLAGGGAELCCPQLWSRLCLTSLFLGRTQAELGPDGPWPQTPLDQRSVTYQRPSRLQRGGHSGIAGAVRCGLELFLSSFSTRANVAERTLDEHV